MAPVHADLMDRTIVGILAEKRKNLGQKMRELVLRHFPRGHGKLSMLDAPKAGNMAIDADIIGRIREDEVRAIVAHQKAVGRRIGRIAANEDMFSEKPDVTRSADGRPGRVL